MQIDRNIFFCMSPTVLDLRRLDEIWKTTNNYRFDVHDWGISVSGVKYESNYVKCRHLRNLDGTPYKKENAVKVELIDGIPQYPTQTTEVYNLGNLYKIREKKERTISKGYAFNVRVVGAPGISTESTFEYYGIYNWSLIRQKPNMEITLFETYAINDQYHARIIAARELFANEKETALDNIAKHLVRTPFIPIKTFCGEYNTKNYTQFQLKEYFYNTG